MIFFALLGIIVISAGFGFLAWKKITCIRGQSRFHSKPVYHVVFTVLCSATAGLFILMTTLVISSYITETKMNTLLDQYMVQNADIPEIRDGDLTQIERDLIMSDAKAIAGNTLPSREDFVRLELGEQRGHLDKISFMSNIALTFLGSVIAGWIAYRKLTPMFRARIHTESFIRASLAFSACIAILTTLGIILALIGETFSFFSKVPFIDFLFGTTWSPLSGVFKGKLEPDKFGAISLFTGTLMITVIALAVAVPCGLFAAVYLSDFASSRTRVIIKPVLEVLAGIPTVVYGFFAAITVAPIIRDVGQLMGLDVGAQSALAAGSVMGIMIIPFISSLSDDVINAVPQSLRDGALALGATKGETIWKVVLPAALPGIVSAIILAVSRAAGETMIVVMAAGQSANLTWNPLESVTTVTVQIVALITGDAEAETAAGPAFALGFVLFCMTLIFNIIALLLVRKYRERYE